MEIIELMILYKSGKILIKKVILLPKQKNEYILKCEKEHEIIGVILNSNDKNYLRQIFDKNFMKIISESMKQYSNNNYLKNIIRSLDNHPIAKLVFLRDLFFCMQKNEIKEFNSKVYFEFCIFMLENTFNTFIKNELLKQFVFAIINFCPYYTIITKEDYDFFKTINENSEMIYKRKAIDVLFNMMFTETKIKKNIINYIIDLLYHFYNMTVVTSIEFYEKVSYLDEVTY